MEQKKLHYLDGLRGLMAINVILCHFVIVYFPQMHYLNFAKSIGGRLSLFCYTSLSALINGNIAVQYFFVLTGFLVARSVFLKDIDAHCIRTKSVNRYVRLLPIVALATVFTHITMELGLQKHLDVAGRVLNPEFLPRYCNFEPTISRLFKNIFINTFISGNDYIGPFWTIRYEFWGYLLCMAVAQIFKTWKWRKLAFCALLYICLNMLDPNYYPFILGIFVADFIYNKNEDCLSKFYEKFINKKYFIVICFIVGTILACCPMNFTWIYRILDDIPKLTTNVVRSSGIALVMYAILHMPKIQGILSAKPLLFLARFSFEVYALHWPIMLVLQCWLFSVFYSRFSYKISAILAFLITLPFIYGISYCVHLFIKYVSGFKFKKIIKGKGV